MSRAVLSSIVFASVVATAWIGGKADAQVAKSQPVVRTWQGGTGYMNIPGYYMLGQEQIQKEIELVDEQKKQLKEMATKFAADSRKIWSQAGAQDLSPEERRAKYTENRKKYQEMVDQLKKQVEADVLLPHQVERLKKIHFRTRAPYMLASPYGLTQLKLDDEQKEKMNRIREEQQERTRQLQKEMLEKALDVLTPEQKKKLEEMTAPGYRYQAVKRGGV